MMKKRIVAVTVAICLMALLLPAASRAAITPYFMAVNDTLLPFKTDTMPYISGGEYLVPVKVFGGLGIYDVPSVDTGFVRLYRGVKKYVDFYTTRGVTEDTDGNVLNWPSARRIGGSFYVPLRQVCDYFSLTYEIIAVPRDIIANEQMWIIRIIASASINNPTFISLNKNALRNSYNEYYAPPVPVSPPPPNTAPPPPPQEEPPPDFSDVTIHLSFFDVSEESAGGILELLDIQTASGFHSCFFVKAGDIRENPGFIRKISGIGHTIGIMLAEGTYEEYLETSALLFEAAKIKTVLVSADESVLADKNMAEENGLILWESSQALVDYGDRTVDGITGDIPQESGARRNLMFPCSETAASLLPGVISLLLENNYTIERITETVAPSSTGAYFFNTQEEIQSEIQ